MTSETVDVRDNPHLKRFYALHIPEAAPGALNPIEGAKEAFGPFPAMTRLDAMKYLYFVGPDLVKDLVGLSYEEFEKGTASRLRMLHRLMQMGRTDQLTDRWSAEMIYNCLPAKRSFKAKLVDVAANQRHRAHWSFEPVAIGSGFAMHQSFFTHPESPFALEIVDRAGQQVATAGFRLLRNPTGTVLSINSIQGVKGKATELQSLSNALNENWRVHLAKRLLEHARKHRFAVEGELPKKYSQGYLLPSQDSEHARQQRQYAQTYQKLGFTPPEGKGAFWRRKGAWRYKPR